MSQHTPGSSHLPAAPRCAFSPSLHLVLPPTLFLHSIRLYKLRYCSPSFRGLTLHARFLMLDVFKALEVCFTATKQGCK